MQQQVPQRYVVPTTTTDIREVLQATTQEVLSRNRLLQIIDEFDLYAKERKRLSPEGLLDLMRRNIGIQPLESQPSQKDVNSFQISFIANNPRLSQQVTSRLTSLFIEQNLVTREHQATTTTKFLQEQLETAKDKLAAAEEQVRSFKMQYLGELPEQQQGNLAILNGLQTQLQNTMNALSRAQEQREYLKSLTGYRALTIEGDLARLKSERVTLLSRYTPQYPAVLKLDEKIAQTESLLETLGQPGAPGKPTVAPEPVSSMGTDQDPAISLQLKSQLEANRLEIENLTREQGKLKVSIEQYQMRLNRTPVREQQLAGILRNYDQLKQDYADLLNKEIQSRMAADLEKRQEGQQFRMVDEPSLPTIPFSPNRIKINLAGLGAGIGIGLVLALWGDMNDHFIHGEGELGQRFPQSMIIGIPLLLTPAEQKTKATRKMFERIAGIGLMVIVLITELYEYHLYRHG